MFEYQYDTSPRKIRPEYEKRKVQKKRPIKKQSTQIKQKLDNQKQTKINLKSKVYFGIKCFLMFVIFQL